MKKYSILLLGLIFTFASAQSQDYKVIVNKSNTTSNLSKKEISKLFLKKDKKWDDGQKVAPIDQKANSEVRQEFTKSVHNKSVNAVKSYWQQAIFAGNGLIPPVEKGTDAEIIAFVSANVGSIGYVSVNTDISAVKELKISD